MRKQPNSGDDDVDSKVAATDSASELPVEVVTAAELVSVNREIAMTKRNKRQAASALKEIKRCGIAAIKSGAEVGAVCTLKVDYRTHSHAQGLIAIVYDVKTTGSILVCCDHGVITHSGTKAEYWVPVDKYKIVARNDEGCPLPADLADVRQMVCQESLTQNRVLGFHIQSFMKRVLTQLARSRGVRDANAKMECV
jgi:hypothetical protein